MDKSIPDKQTGDRNNDIEALRDAIDAIDEKILGLINQRLLLALQIGRFKKQSGIQIVDSSREKAVLGRLRERNAGPLQENALHQIFTAIIAAARDIQNK
jgi:chorismate mutase/prephenate dehydratase